MDISYQTQKDDVLHLDYLLVGQQDVFGQQMQLACTSRLLFVTAEAMLPTSLSV